MDRDLGIVPVRRRDGQSRFRGPHGELDIRLEEFWAWSTSDLVVNTNRGVLAEFLVARALGDERDVRNPWDPFDVKSADGITVEVKSGSYIQAWAQKARSYLEVAIAPTRAWSPKTGKWESGKRRQADVYVYCLLKHRDQQSLNPMDLDQWEFFVIPTRLLDEHCGAAKSVALSRLRKLGVVSVPYGQLPEAVTKAA